VGTGYDVISIGVDPDGFNIKGMRLDLAGGADEEVARNARRQSASL